tara:strand:- start:197 stop:595 length:399 start_codon:yes stop_codon:yes gene_type:complete
MSNLVYNGKQNIQIGDVGEQTAYEDELVRRTSNNIKKTEQKIMNEYNNLNNIKKTEQKLMSEFLPSINDELDKRRVFLNYKKTSLENQHTALTKLLEHLLMIELKNKEFDTEEILTKLNMIETELIPYNKIL